MSEINSTVLSIIKKKKSTKCSLSSPTLFNIFIKDIIDQCKRYGVIIERKKKKKKKKKKRL